jgi:hypothetical protein
VKVFGKRHLFLPVVALLAMMLSSGFAYGQEEIVDPVGSVPAGAVSDSNSLSPARPDSVASAEAAAASAIAALEIDLWDSAVNPGGAVLMTPVFPGWGQLYADNSWRGALSFGMEMFYWTNMLARDLRATRYRGFATTFPTDNPNYGYYNGLAEENWEQMRDFAWWSGGVLLIIALDAYVGAHLFHFDDDPVPVPNQWDDHFEPMGYDMPGSATSPSLVVFQWRKTF